MKVFEEILESESNSNIPHKDLSESKATISDSFTRL